MTNNLLPTAFDGENVSSENASLKEQLRLLQSALEVETQARQTAEARLRELEQQQEQKTRQQETKQQGEAALGDTFHYLQAMLDNVEASIVACDTNGQLIFSNRCARQWRGLPNATVPIDYLAQHHDTFYIDGSPIVNIDDYPLVRAFKGETLRDYQFEIRPANAPHRVLEVNSQPLIDAAGRKLGAVSVARDITAQKQIEKELRQSQARLAVLLANLPVIIFALDAKGVFTFSDGQGLRVLGVAPGAVVGVSAFELYQDYPEIIENIRLTLSGQGDGHWQSNVDGKIFETQCRPLFDERGRICGLTGVFLDLTAQKNVESALRESEQRFRAALDGSLDAFYILQSVRDTNGEIEDFVFVEVNALGARLVSRTREEIIGQKFCELFPFNRDNGIFDGHVRVVKTRMPIEKEFPVAASDVRASWVRHQVVPLGDGVAITARDITERKHSEERLQEYTKLLEASNHELENFAYVASHDLQEPLRKIRAFGDRLAHKNADELSPEALDSIARMQSAAQRMQQLLEDLLTYSRLATRTRPFAPVNLNKIAQEVAASFRDEVERSGAQITIGDLPTIQGDNEQIRQLFCNLFDNALKFRREGVTPLIEVRGTSIEMSPDAMSPDQSSTGKAAYCLEIKDNSMGFDEKYLDRIFAPFQRLHAQGVYEGNGIGLALCRKIAERHDGNITAHSTPNQGSTFIVTLPQNVATTSVATTSVATTEDARSEGKL